MTVDESRSTPPPPSAEAVQLSELRRAEVLTYTRSLGEQPWWFRLMAGAAVAVHVWIYSLPADRQTLPRMLVLIVCLPIGLLLRRRAGATPNQHGMNRLLGRAKYAILPMVAVGVGLLWLLWQVVPWWTVAMAGFVIGVAFHDLNLRIIRRALTRVEHRALERPTGDGR